MPSDPSHCSNSNQARNMFHQRREETEKKPIRSISSLSLEPFATFTLVDTWSLFFTCHSCDILSLVYNIKHDSWRRTTCIVYPLLDFSPHRLLIIKPAAMRPNYHLQHITYNSIILAFIFNSYVDLIIFFHCADCTFLIVVVEITYNICLKNVMLYSCMHARLYLHYVWTRIKIWRHSHNLIYYIYYTYIHICEWIIHSLMSWPPIATKSAIYHRQWYSFQLKSSIFLFLPPRSFFFHRKIK